MPTGEQRLSVVMTRGEHDKRASSTDRVEHLPAVLPSLIFANDLPWQH